VYKSVDASRFVRSNGLVVIRVVASLIGVTDDGRVNSYVYPVVGPTLENVIV